MKISQNDSKVRERNTQVQVSLRIPKSIDRAVEIEAAKQDVTKRQLIEDALRAFLQTASAA